MKIAKTAAMVLALGIVVLGAGAAANMQRAASLDDAPSPAVGEPRGRARLLPSR